MPLRKDDVADVRVRQDSYNVPGGGPGMDDGTFLRSLGWTPATDDQHGGVPSALGDSGQLFRQHEAHPADRFRAANTASNQGDLTSDNAPPPARRPRTSLGQTRGPVVSSDIGASQDHTRGGEIPPVHLNAREDHPSINRHDQRSSP
jgi:hypothetical protein